jgi:hypothetical protein
MIDITAKIAKPPAPIDRDQELRAGHRADVDDAVERQNAGAAVVGRTGIEPGLDDREKTGETEAGDEADRRPDQRIDHEHQDERARRRDGGECGKGAHVADRLHHARDRQAADEEAAEIGRAHQADGGRREPLLRAAQRDQRALQPVAAEQDAGGEEERNQRPDRGHRGHLRVAGRR